MTIPRILKTKSLKYILALAFVSSLTACSGGDGGLAGEGSTTTFGALGFSWTTPDEREDGNTLLISEISEYRIYYGTTAGDYQSQVNVDVASNTVQVPQLPAGTYYVVVTAVDTEGRESLYSSEVVITV